MRGRVLKILVPVLILGAAIYVRLAPYDNWGGVKYLFLAGCLTVYAATVTRGRLRDIGVLVAAILFPLAGIEAYSVVTQARPTETRSADYSGYRTILGWGPRRPGVFHNIDYAARTHKVIYDATYTIDRNLNRKVIASDTGPLVAFFGDSFTFGTGLQDSQTLPQIFSDLYGHKLGVMNFAFPGYGPQQFLRAIETNMYDPLLRHRARLFIFETATFHIPRSSCTAGFMLPAPRYVLEDGKPVYTGACWQSASAPLELFANTALYRSFFEPLIGLPTKSQVDLYVAILARAAELVREKYGAPTIILFIRGQDAYLSHSGYTEADLLRNMHAAGLDIVDVTLYPWNYPGKPIEIAGDGHPTGFANSLRAAILKRYLDRNPTLMTAAKDQRALQHND